MSNSNMNNENEINLNIKSNRSNRSQHLFKFNSHHNFSKENNSSKNGNKDILLYLKHLNEGRYGKRGYANEQLETLSSMANEYDNKLRNYGFKKKKRNILPPINNASGTRCETDLFIDYSQPFQKSKMKNNLEESSESSESDLIEKYSKYPISNEIEDEDDPCFDHNVNKICNKLNELYEKNKYVPKFKAYVPDLDNINKEEYQEIMKDNKLNYSTPMFSGSNSNNYNYLPEKENKNLSVKTPIKTSFITSYSKYLGSEPNYGYNIRGQERLNNFGNLFSRKQNEIINKNYLYSNKGNNYSNINPDYNYGGNSLRLPIIRKINLYK